MQVTDILGDAGATETLTPGDTVTGISASVYKLASGFMEGRQAIGALITCEGNSANITFDGTDPSAAAATNVGHSFDAGDSYVLRGVQNVLNFKCIDRASGSASKIKVTTYF
jgi:hypothetical protein